MLQRYFGEIKDVDIIVDASYREANVLFDNEGLGDREHYPKIEQEDLKNSMGVLTLMAQLVYWK